MDIIKRCQTEDMAAFANLFEHYKNLVYRTVLLMQNDRHDAEDILQDVFLQVFRTIAS